MKASLLFILGLLLTTAYVSAIDSLIFVKQIHIQSTQFTTDPVGNVYIVKGNNTLLKYNAKGDSIGFFNEIKKGKITQVDASNPLRILIFLADYGNVLMLDNLLTLKNTLKLNSLGIINATCIANSADGSIWAYDPSGMLMKINNKPEISFTISLRNIVDQALDPIYMIEQDRSLYLVDSTQGIKKFDQFGFLKTSFPFLTKEIQYFNSYLVYYIPPYLVSYNTQSLQELKLMLPQHEDIVKVRVERNIVYILRKESLDIYSLPSVE